MGKESACKAGDPGSIPRSGRSSTEGIGYPLQYSWASLVTQIVKNLPAMWETWDRSLGREDPLEEGMATHSSILAWRIAMDRGAWRATVQGVTKNQTRLSNYHFLFSLSPREGQRRGGKGAAGGTESLREGGGLHRRKGKGRRRALSPMLP